MRRSGRAAAAGDRPLGHTMAQSRDIAATASRPEGHRGMGGRCLALGLGPGAAPAAAAPAAKACVKTGTVWRTGAGGGAGA